MDLDEVRRVRDEHQASDDLDVQTANAILTVHDALSGWKREQFAALDMDQAAQASWKVLGQLRKGMHR